MKQINNREYQGVLINRLSFQNQLFVEFISKLILKGKITLDEVPQNLRIKHRAIYTSALRISRIDCKTLIKDLKLILSDIECAEVQSDKDKIIDIFSFDFQYLKINYLGDKEVNDFERSIPEEILQKL